MANASQVAKLFLHLGNNTEEGDVVTALKLQKLLYYAQGFHLALYQKPLFPERLMAWENGPVVQEVYNEYRQYGASPIPAPTDYTPTIFSEAELELLREVWDEYGQYTAWRLRNMTHDEAPWRETARNAEITHEKLTAFFKNFVNGQA